MLSIIETNFLKFSKQTLIKNYCARSFSSDSKLKVLIVFEPSRISFCQIYPFMYYREEFKSQFGVEFRYVSSNEIKNRVGNKCRDVDVILLQTWFDISNKDLVQRLDFLKSHNPRAKIHFVDSFAPADLRLSATLDSYIDGYITKTVMLDRTEYSKERIGGVFLDDYYHKLYSIEGEPQDWSVKESIFNKLVVGPTFNTGAEFIDVFQSGKMPRLDGRNIDLHARLTAEGTPWYTKMRKHAMQAVNDIKGIKSVTGVGISRKHFIAEMKDSKVCFSPFGYGEICWRDIEAIMAGAVLVKPDMGHLEMDPVIHVPDETYVSVKWDFSDLEEKVIAVLQDDEKRKSIAQNAFMLIKEYTQSKQFVKKFSYLFEL